MTDDQHDDIVTLLHEILDVLRVLATPLPDEPGDAATDLVCEHPECHRTDFSTPGAMHWVCSACGHTERQGTVGAEQAHKE